MSADNPGLSLAEIARRKAAMSPQQTFSEMGSAEFSSMDSLDASKLEYKIPSMPDLLELDTHLLEDCVITQLTQAYDSPVPQTWEKAKSALGSSVNATHFDDSYRTREMYCKYTLDTFKSMDQLLENNKKWAELMYPSLTHTHYRIKARPTFFTDLTSMQAPQVLWIGW